MVRMMLCGAARLALVPLAVLVAGCFGGAGATCPKPEEYQQAREVEAVTVPADLERPLAPNRLEVPDVSPAQGEEEARPCLTRPPDFFGRPVQAAD